MACSYYLFQQTCGTCEFFIARGCRMTDKEVKLDNSDGKCPNNPGKTAYSSGKCSKWKKWSGK